MSRRRVWGSFSRHRRNRRRTDLGVAAGIRVIVGLYRLRVGFRRVGAKNGALTLPHWLGARYESKAMATLFGLISLLSLCFVVLIVGSLSIIMQQTLGLTNVEVRKGTFE